MINNTIFRLVNQRLDIPMEIHKSIVRLFHVNELNEISKEDVKKCFLYHNGKEFKKDLTNYQLHLEEYTLYYLPVNFYKIWRPLTDLLEKNQIRTKCSILELGSGPGTSVLGLIEFYK